VYYPALIGAALFTQERKRTGGLIDIELKPNDDVTLDLSGFTSKLDATNYKPQLSGVAPHTSWPRAPARGTGSRLCVDQRPPLTSATFSPVPGTFYGVYDQIFAPR